MKPNIILILTDDQRADTLGCMGNTIVKTPNLDRLAENGMMFRNATCTSSLCTPSRVSIFTGLYERQHAINFNSGTALHESAWGRAYPTILKQHGYFTGYIGKNHTPVGPTGYASHVMDNSFDYWYASHKHLLFYPKEKPAGMVVTPGYDDTMFDNAKADTQVEILDEGVMNFLRPQDDFCSNAVRFLEKRPDNKPFCLSVCFNLPHDAGTETMQQRPSDDALYRDAYRDKKVAIEADLPKTYCAKADIKNPKLPLDVLHAEYRQAGYNYVDTKGELVERITRRYQTIEGIDRFVGKLMRSLEELGLAENTAIIFSTDHGIHRGEFGLGGKGLNYEPCLRVPLLVYHPKLAPEQTCHESDKLVQSIDIAPTILEIAGVPVPGAMQGDSMLPLLRDPDASWRQHTFAENLWSNCFGNPRIESVRREDGWKYIRYFKNDISQHDRSLTGKTRAAVSHAEAKRYRENLSASICGEEPVHEELFDLTQDPDEMTNLATRRVYEDVLESCRELCRESVTRAYGFGPVAAEPLLDERREAFLEKQTMRTREMITQ